MIVRKSSKNINKDEIIYGMAITERLNERTDNYWEKIKEEWYRIRCM
jgi:hypothetical protein